MIRWKRLFPLFLGAACSVFLAGCHGSRETEAFQPPETFDETKTYDIVPVSTKQIVVHIIFDIRAE